MTKNIKYTLEYFDQEKQRRREGAWNEWNQELERLFAKREASEYDLNDLLAHITKRLHREAISAFGRVDVSGKPSRHFSAEDEAMEHAQDVALRISEKLGDFKSAEELSRYISTSIGHFAGEAGNRKIDSERFEDIFVRVEDEDGTVREIDNPILNYNHTPVECARKLPAFIQGMDLRICEMIRAGYGYNQIAKHLNLTVTTVTKRVERMRKKTVAETKEKIERAITACPRCQGKETEPHTAQCMSARFRQRRLEVA